MKTTIDPRHSVSITNLPRTSDKPKDKAQVALMNAQLANENLNPKSAGPYKIMLVDDSAVILGALRNILKSNPAFDVVTTAVNGEAAIRQLKLYQDIEIIILDIEMPIMDGITAIPKLLEVKSDVKIIISSTLSKRNADISMKALQIGATDYITKPSSVTDPNVINSYKEELYVKLNSLGMKYRKAHDLELPKSLGPSAATVVKPTTSIEKANTRTAVQASIEDQSITLRRLPTIFKPSIIAIGSSTGGPQALFKLIPYFKKVKLPIFITQHMPPTFTTILAEHISKLAEVNCVEAKEGDIIEPGKIYLAPGDYHMGIKLASDGKTKKIFLDHGPQLNFCRPAVDFMLESLCEVYDPKKILNIILTGMGQDGLIGATKVSDEGGVVMAQDRKTSVVWGMPGAVATAGICHIVENIENLGDLAQDMTKDWII